MDIDGGYFDSDPGTTSNTSAPDTSASGGSDQPVNDPFSYYDPYTGGYTNTPGWSPGEYEAALKAIGPVTTGDTPEQQAVRDLYQEFLGREPENRAVLNEWAQQVAQHGINFARSAFARDAQKEIAEREARPVTVEEVLGLPQEDEAGLKEVIDYVKDLFTTSPTPVAPTTPAPTTTNPVGAPNVVGTPVSGGYLVDSQNNPVLSTSYGLPGEYTPESPQLPADTLAAAAKAVGLPVEGLLDSQGLRELPTGEFVKDSTQLSTTGLDYGTLEALQNEGLGSLEISPTQTVDQALAAKTAHEYLNEYAPTIMGALTGFGPQINAVQTLQKLASGQITPGQAVLGVGLGALANKTGIPSQTLSNVAQGRLGDAAGSLATGAATSLLGSQLGLGPFSGPAAGIIMKETGLGPFIGSKVDRAVTDVVPDQNWNLLDTVGGGIDQVLKDMGLPVYSDTQYRGEPITPSLPGTPSYGDAYDGGGRGGDNMAPTTPTTPTTPEPPKQEQTITLQPRMALQPEIYQGRYGPLMRYNYVPVGD